MIKNLKRGVKHNRYACYEIMNKIVVIEDTIILQIRLERLISSIGTFEVVEYNRLSRSFETLYNKFYDIRVIVLDLDSRADLLDEVYSLTSNLNNTLKPKIIVLTSSVEYQLMLKLYEKGVDEILLKPFTDEVFIDKLIGLKGSGNSKIINYDIQLNNVMGGKTMLKWCNDFEIGIEMIDAEHKNIIDHFEKLYILMKEGKGKEYYNDLIKFLKDYVNTHFDHEEELQLKIGYINLEEHKKIHNEFRYKVEHIIERTHWHSITNKELLDLNLFIKDWLVNHIMIEDKKFGSFYIEKNYR